MYCVNENQSANPRFAFYFQIFNFSFYHSYITHMHIFHQSFLSLDYEIFDNFVFSLKELKSLMATTGGMSALLTSCYILLNVFICGLITLLKFFNLIFQFILSIMNNTRK